MQTVELGMVYKCLLKEIGVFLLLERTKEAEGVFSAATRLALAHGIDSASASALFALLRQIPNAHTYAQNIARFATPEELQIIASAKEASYALTCMRQAPVAPFRPLFD